MEATFLWLREILSLKSENSCFQTIISAMCWEPKFALTWALSTLWSVLAVWHVWIISKWEPPFFFFLHRSEVSVYKLPTYGNWTKFSDSEKKNYTNRSQVIGDLDTKASSTSSPLLMVKKPLAGCGSVAKPLLLNSHSANLMKSSKNKVCQIECLGSQHFLLFSSENLELYFSKVSFWVISVIELLKDSSLYFWFLVIPSSEYNMKFLPLEYWLHWNIW